MGHPRRRTLVWIGIATVGVAMALWLRNARGVSPRLDAAPEGSGVAPREAKAPYLEGRGQRAAAAVGGPAAADGATAPPANDWEVLPEAAEGDRVVLELPVPAIEADSEYSWTMLTAYSSVGEMRWIGILGEAGRPPQFLFSNPPAGIEPLAEVSEGGTLGEDGSWIVRTTLTSGRWLVLLSSGSYPGAPPASPAWAWVTAGAAGTRVRLPRSDPDRMGRLRVWARAEGQHSVTVRWRGFVWAVGGAPSSPEDAEGWLVPADEDLLVTFGGYDPNGWTLGAPSRTVRVAPGGATDVGFEVPPLVTVRLTARPPRTGSGVTWLRAWREESAEAPAYETGAREVAPDSWEMRVPPGNYLALAIGAGLAGSARARFRVEAPGPVFVDLPWSEAGTTFRLRLLEADGTGAAALPVVLRRDWRREGAPAVEAHGATDSEGYLTLGPVEAGPLDVLVEPRGLIASVHVPAEDGQTLEALLPATTEPERTGGVTVRLEQADGMPWPEAPAILARSGEAWAHYAATTGWRGEGYVFSRLAAGDYVLTMAGPSSRERSPGVTIPVTVAAGQHRRLVARPRAPLPAGAGGGESADARPVPRGAR